MNCKGILSSKARPSERNLPHRCVTILKAFVPSPILATPHNLCILDLIILTSKTVDIKL